MRKFTLILMLVAFTGFVFAQNNVRQHALTSGEKAVVEKSDFNKDPGDVFWSYDFSNEDLEADGWSNVDLSDENQPWIWTTDTIEGAYSPNTVTWPESETGATGYMAMPADGYNSVPQFTTVANGGNLAPSLIAVDAYFQSPIITDCSDKPGVILGMWANYRWFTSMVYEVEVSNDYDVDSPEDAHWDAYRVNLEHISAINDPARNEFREINITATAGNMEEIVIRWRASGSTHYFWNVDDVELSEPYVHNMLLNNNWAFYDWKDEAPEENPGHADGYLQHGGYYYMIPKDQAAAFVGFQGAIQNFGGNDETDVVMTTTITHHDTLGDVGDVVYTTNTETKDVDIAVLDTLFGEADFTPEEWGWYDIDMELTMTDEEGYPDDNVAHLEFIVTDSIYSRTTEEFTSSVATRNWVGGGFDGDGLGVLFTLNADPFTEIKGMKWYFSQRNEDYMDYITGGTFTYICRVFGYDEDADDWAQSPIISADLGIIQPEDTGTWIYSEFQPDGNSEYLVPGDYQIFIETNTGADPETTPVGFYMGEDLTYAQPDVTYILWLEGSWGWGTGNPSFQMWIAAEDWVRPDSAINAEEVKADLFANSLGSNYPNPASANTLVKYRIDQTTKVTLNVFDVTGKRVISMDEGMQQAGRHEVTLDVSDLKAGIYFYTLEAGHFTQTRKMVVVD